MNKCEVCGHDDLPLRVFGSGLGPVSFTYCELCAGIGAEPKEMIEFIDDGNMNFNGLLFYDAIHDVYRYYNEPDIVYGFIVRETGEILNTRSEVVKDMKENM
jgi:hypothetical protein